MISGAIAVSLGAKLIEKHFTLRCYDKGPDHFTSLNPLEFKNYVKLIRETEVMMGSNKKMLQSEEINMKNISRKSLYYAENLNKNTIIKSRDFLNLRPGTGINSFEMNNLINRKIKKNVKFQQKVKITDFYD